MKHRFLKGLALVLFLPLNGLAQSLLADTLTPVMNHSPRWVVKFAPLALFDVDNTVEFGVERLLGSRRSGGRHSGGRHSIQAEFGYGWRAINLYPNRREEYEGFEVWRGRAEWRRYSGRYRSYRRPHFATAPIGRYFAVETFFKQVTVLQNTSVGRECVDGTCAFFERGTFPMFRTVWGVHCKVGRQFVLTMPGENRLLLDFYMGLGFRSVTPYRFTNSTNEDVVRPSGIGFWTNQQGGLRPSGTLGIKLGYVL
ncbi:hypothetical protein GCM10028803_23980 [Larkinella knui]|uniref:DUF3575 domain-containing protein n=1 Tax=Larkinella knui TaxID=2025310 RepID=A0A3P1CVZ4_9BACT|nr:hypothetical protein [Larkinella knui]RRB17463.1 hypothetical protein EHT87_04025 [Larkinella knui]